MPTTAGQMPRRFTARRTFRQAIWQGLAILMPSLLTVAILLWIGGTVHYYVLGPMTEGSRTLLVWWLADVHDTPPEPATSDGRNDYVQLADSRYVPRRAYEEVRAAGGPLPATADELYHRWVDQRILRPHLVLPLFLVVFVGGLYLLGRFVVFDFATIGWNALGRAVKRMPLVRVVYSSVEQVINLLLGKQDIRFSRVVAVEYPARGLWSLGFVTSDDFPELSQAAEEPVMAVLICTFPLPFKGCVVLVRRSEALELNLSVDQAAQFIMSSGVILPRARLRTLERPSKGARLLPRHSAGPDPVDGTAG